MGMKESTSDRGRRGTGAADPGNARLALRGESDTPAAMRSWVFLAVLAFAGVAHAEPRWTFGPTASGGFAWTDGQRDYVGDVSFYDGMPSYYQPVRCYGSSTAGPPYGRTAPSFSLGGLVTRDVSQRWTWTLGSAFAVGPTHPFGERFPNAGPTLVVRDDTSADLYSPDIRLHVRVTSTMRLRLGARRRGFLGAGGGAGWLADLSPRPETTVPWPSPGSISPDEPAKNARNRHPQSRGLTLEAVLEGGVLLGSRRRCSLSWVVAAGRPLVRSELVLAIPFSVGR